MKCFQRYASNAIRPCWIDLATGWNRQKASNTGRRSDMAARRSRNSADNALLGKEVNDASEPDSPRGLSGRETDCRPGIEQFNRKPEFVLDHALSMIVNQERKISWQ